MVSSKLWFQQLDGAGIKLGTHSLGNLNCRKHRLDE